MRTAADRDDRIHCSSAENRSCYKSATPRLVNRELKVGFGGAVVSASRALCHTGRRDFSARKSLQQDAIDFATGVRWQLIDDPDVLGNLYAASCVSR